MKLALFILAWVLICMLPAIIDAINAPKRAEIESRERIELLKLLMP